MPFIASNNFLNLLGGLQTTDPRVARLLAGLGSGAGQEGGIDPEDIDPNSFNASTDSAAALAAFAPKPAGGPIRLSRPGRGRPRGAADERDRVPPDSIARSGASESLVTSPAQTRSHNAASSSTSVASAEAARS